MLTAPTEEYFISQAGSFGDGQRHGLGRRPVQPTREGECKQDIPFDSAVLVYRCGQSAQSTRVSKWRTRSAEVRKELTD